MFLKLSLQQSCSVWSSKSMILGENHSLVFFRRSGSIFSWSIYFFPPLHLIVFYALSHCHEDFLLCIQAQAQQQQCCSRWATSRAPMGSLPCSRAQEYEWGWLSLYSHMQSQIPDWFPLRVYSEVTWKSWLVKNKFDYIYIYKTNLSRVIILYVYWHSRLRWFTFIAKVVYVSGLKNIRIKG